MSINQTLVKKLCPHCKKSNHSGSNIENLKRRWDDGTLLYAYTDPLEKIIEEAPATWEHNPEGCEKCIPYGTPGYLGRVPIYEYFLPNVELVEWILKEKPTRFQIEERVCSTGLGSSKLMRYLELLKEGIVDAEMETIMKGL
jgi:type II secretory ATPase GspE/PulE/Tfp pilus assembly ATPase PilB-like protein